MPAADGNLNMYILPVGQGDAHVIQCPGGEVAIVDMGKDSRTKGREFWTETNIKSFLAGNMVSEISYYIHVFSFVLFLSHRTDLDNHMITTCTS